jgi:hypothetical protein
MEVHVIILLLPPQCSMILATCCGSSDMVYLQVMSKFFEFVAVSTCLQAWPSREHICVVVLLPPFIFGSKIVLL